MVAQTAVYPLTIVSGRGEERGAVLVEKVQNPQKTETERGDPNRASIDLAAIERVRGGDLDAFRELFTRYENRARAIAFGVVGNRDDAEDVVQEAFLKAYRNLGSFRGQSSFYTWFYRIVFNLAIDLSRKRYRKVESSLGETDAIDSLNLHAGAGGRAGTSATGHGSDLLGHVVGPEDAVNRSDIAHSIAKALDTLTADHRAVIVLREIEGLSYSEISDVVGCSKGTVMSRLHHARKRMQRVLREYLPWYTPGKMMSEGTESDDDLALATRNELSSRRPRRSGDGGNASQTDEEDGDSDDEGSEVGYTGKGV